MEVNVHKWEGSKSLNMQSAHFQQSHSKSYSGMFVEHEKLIFEATTKNSSVNKS